MVNTSPFNTGLKQIPLKPRPPMLHYNRSCAIIGGVYHHPKAGSPHKFPRMYDNCLFFGDWNRSWIKVIRLDRNENMVAVEDFPVNFKFRKVIDFFFHEGELYVLEFGNGWHNTKGGRMSKISFSTKFNQKSDPSADPRIAGLNHKDKGTQRLLNATCLSCHHAQSRVVGPSFVEMQTKYKANDKAAIEKLVDKVTQGGVGVWGKIPMPAHPQYKKDEIELMIQTMLKAKNLSTGHKK